ncbi:hypothetical protein MRX96_013836 [Rhipicephalus microplus]
MHQQSSQSEDMGLASQPSSASRSSAALPTAFRMSRRDLIATALLVSGTCPLYFECESSACRATAEDLRKNVAWTLNPCADFYEYVCSSDRARTNVYDHAVAHYLREVREVIRKYENLGFFSRTAMSKRITHFFSACQSSRLDLSSWRSQLAHVWKYLDLIGDLAGLESMLATFSRVLEVFPIVQVSVLEASRRTCVVLTKPDGNGADRIFSVPHVFTTSFRRFALDLLGHTGHVPGEVDDLVNSAAKVEAQLLKYSGPQGERYYHLHEYGDIPASQVGNGSSAFDWTTYLRNFLTGIVAVKADSCVIVKSPAYVRHVVKVFGKVSKKDVRSFLKLRAAMTLIPFRKLADGPEKEEVERLCTLATYKLYRYAFLKEFNDTQLLSVFVSAGEKEVIVRMSYRNVLTEAQPMSNATSRVEEAMKKAKAKYFRIIRDVNRYYHSDATKPDKEIAYNFDNQLNVRWDFDPDKNKLIVPVSIGHMKLKSEKEFFLESTSLGGAMVQFLYRAFHERTLFSMATADQNERRKASATACLEKQYGSKAINSTKVNGRRVLRAVAADNALVPVLHKAFKTSLYIHKIEVINYKRLEMSLASLPDVDADQLFFLMYGQTLCEPHEDTARVLAEAPWPPAKIRLNTALANYPEFAKAFKCGNDTAMSPKKRCSLFNSN